MINRKINILLNYLFLILILVSIEYIVDSGITLWLAIMILTIIVLFIISFIRCYGKTGVWKIVHKSSEQLDEREYAIILKAVKTSYAIFTITILIIIYIQFLFNYVIFNALNGAALIYIAHILPCSIVAWKLKQI